MWSMLVLASWAHAVISFIFWLHVIPPPYQVGEFILWRAPMVIALTAAAAYVIGAIWNCVHRI